jgi:hypothetical protein
MYWNYGMSYPVLFAAALRHATGDDGGFFSAPRMTNAHRYVETILGGDGRFMTFNDTQPWLNGWTVAAAMGPRLDQPLLRWLADEIARQGAADETVPGEVSRPSYARTALLLRDERPGPAPFPGVPTLSRLESIQEGVLRSDGALRPRLVVGVKGNGKDHTHHAQADAGSFVFYARGEGFLIDPGYYQPGAAAHSLPLLGGDDGTAGGGERTPAPLGEAWERGALRTMTVDATAFHQARPGGKAVARCRRVAALAGDRAAVVLDDIAAAAGPLPVVARYQCAMAPAVELGAARARLPGRGTDVLVVLDGAAGAFEVEGPREFGKSWIFRKMAERGEIAWHTLAARAEADPARPLVTVLVPLAKDEAPPAVEVRRAAERVAVFVGGSAAVEFERRDGAWRTAPSP